MDMGHVLIRCMDLGMGMAMVTDIVRTIVLIMATGMGIVRTIALTMAAVDTIMAIAAAVVAAGKISAA